MTVTLQVQAPQGRVSIKKITPDLAARWLETMQYDHQRTVRQHWVEYLSEEMQRGRFQQNTQLHVAYLKGKAHLIDGQHRLWAVITAGLPQSFTVLETHVQTEEALGWLYGQTDVGLRRTAADLYSALDLPAEIGLAASQINALSSAIAFMYGGCVRYDAGTGKRLHRDDLLKTIRLYAPYAREYYEIASGAGREMVAAIKRSPTFALALLTLRFAAPIAERTGAPPVADFWRGTFHDDGVRVNDPRKFANRHLLLSGPKRGTPAYSTRYVGFCFNAFMQRRTLASPRVYDETGELVVFGVPREPSKWINP